MVDGESKWQPAFRPSTIELTSEQAGDAAVGVDVDGLGRRFLGQAGHEHDLAADGHHEAGAGRQKDAVDIDVEVARPAEVDFYTSPQNEVQLTIAISCSILSNSCIIQ